MNPYEILSFKKDYIKYFSEEQIGKYAKGKKKIESYVLSIKNRNISQNEVENALKKVNEAVNLITENPKLLPKYKKEFLNPENKRDDGGAEKEYKAMEMVYGNFLRESLCVSSDDVLNILEMKDIIIEIEKSDGEMTTLKIGHNGYIEEGTKEVKKLIGFWIMKESIEEIISLLPSNNKNSNDFLQLETHKKHSFVEQNQNRIHEADFYSFLPNFKFTISKDLLSEGVLISLNINENVNEFEIEGRIKSITVINDYE